MSKRRSPVVRRVQPEYMRRDIEPAVAGKSRFHDDNGMPIVNKKRQQQMPPPEPISNTPIRIRSTRIDAPVQAKTETPKRGMNARRAMVDVPEQPMAHVGMNQDNMWFDEHVIGKDSYDPNAEMVDNNEEMDIENVDHSGMAAEPSYERWYGRRRIPVEDLSGVASGTGTPTGDGVGSRGDIMPDDIELPAPDDDDDYSFQQPEPEQEKESELALTFLLEKGEYAVLLDNQLVVKSDDLNGIKAVVEDMILTHDIDVSNITVLKSVPIDFGVLLKDG